MKSVCNFDNVMGKMLGLADSEHENVTIDTLKAIDSSGVAHYNDTVNQHSAEVFDNTSPSSTDNKIVSVAGKWFDGSNDVIKRIITDVRNPSGLFGEDTIAPVIDFLHDHYSDYKGEHIEGKQAYMDDIANVFDDIETSHFDPAKQRAWDRYRKFYESGGELYGMSEGSGVEKAVTNTISNFIKSRPSVIVGNIFEGAIKLPTLYGEHTLAAIAQANKAGLLKEIPELIESGMYGHQYAGESLGKWEGLIHLTDRPLKNIAYFAGKLKDGNGLKAVQDVSFTPRLGDLPSVYYSRGGRQAVQLLSYTVNSYKMYAGLWKQAKEGNVTPLLTYHAMATALGSLGAGSIAGAVSAGIPQPVIDVLGAFNPDLKDSLKEDKGVLKDLIQPGNITKLGVSLDILNRQYAKGVTGAVSLPQDIASGEMGKATSDAFDAFFLYTTIGNSWLGDSGFQTAVKLAIDAGRDEVDLEDLPLEAMKRYGLYRK